MSGNARSPLLHLTLHPGMDGKNLAAEGQLETKIASDYEALRRREYELMTGLLDVLPKIDQLNQERVGQVRDALFHADHPYLMVFVGPFSSGKSSIINALLGERDVMRVGPVPTTDRISILRYGDQPDQMRTGDVDTIFYPSPLLKKVSFVDTPGLESVFKEHEETTRKFLHRSDVVLLVMLATQAMTARNLESLKSLKEFGKNVIIIINQADLLTPEEADQVKQYVLDQSQALLGYKPEVWLVSAKRGLEARAGSELDAEIWKSSGLNKIEAYVDKDLGDVSRLRQKLQTPLQITQNVTQAALDAVRANQAALDHYQHIADNITQQLAAQKRDQQKVIRETTDAISDKFGAAAMRGSEAIRENFQLSKAFGSALRGVMELVGLGGLARAGQGGSYVRTTFEKHKAFEPILELPLVEGKLAPRLEGQDVQDVDDLVKYARKEIDALPPAIKEKVIGSVQSPLQYERDSLQAVRPELEQIELEARVVETEKLEQTMRNTLIYLAAWILFMLVLGIAAINIWNGSNVENQPFTPIIIVIIFVALAMLGFLFMPLRGRLLEAAYTRRMLKLQSRYIESVSKAADKQLTYSMNLRSDAVLPLTRLVEAQTQIQNEHLRKLQSAQHEITAIESDLSTLGKRGLLGMRG